MRRAFLCLIILLFTSPVFAILQEFVPGQIIVKFKKPVVQMPRGLTIARTKRITFKVESIRNLNARNKLQKVKQLYRAVGAPNQYVFTFSEEKDIKKILREYEKDPNVELVSLNTIVRAFAAVNPDDPYFSNGTQYYLTNIAAPNAWGMTTGTNETLLAVLDTGINYNHVDLQGKVNLTDAYDFVNGDADPWDDHSGVHGTTVSGVIAAATNNGVGVAGVDWNGKILPIKVLDGNGEGTVANIIEGIEWAVTKGADVINMSFGQYSDSSTLRAACAAAYAANSVLVAAAGNGNVDTATYPAYYSNVLAVAAVDRDDERSVWGGIDPVTGKVHASNYGTWVGVAAPGTSIYTTYKNNSYTSSNGTSLACPVVVGVAGLIKALNPSLTNRQIMNKITSEADNIDALNPSFVGLLGSGRLNAYRSLLSIGANISSPVAGAYIEGSTAISGTASGTNFSSYALEALQNNTFIVTIETSTASVEGGLLGTWDSTAYNGDHTIKLKVFSSLGLSEEASVLVHVDNAAPEAVIGNLISGETLSGTIIITGEAVHSYYFNRYILQYGEGASPTTFETITEVYASVEAGVLGSWKTVGLNGEYTVKLIAIDQMGKTAEQTITINLQNSATPTKEVEAQSGNLPITYALPNPFDRSIYSGITFNYNLDANFLTKIYIFDLNGNLIWQTAYVAGANGGKSGANNPAWDGTNVYGYRVGNGVYLYQIVADNRVLARGKIIVLN